MTVSDTIVLAEDAEAARAFFRDVPELPNVDAGDGWLIFQLPPGELACHPSGIGDWPGPPSGHHELYLMCDSIEATGAGSLGAYQPQHPTAFDLPS